MGYFGERRQTGRTASLLASLAVSQSAERSSGNAIVGTSFHSNGNSFSNIFTPPARRYARSLAGWLAGSGAFDISYF